MISINFTAKSFDELKREMESLLSQLNVPASKAAPTNPTAAAVPVSAVQTSSTAANTPVQSPVPMTAVPTAPVPSAAIPVAAAQTQPINIPIPTAVPAQPVPVAAAPTYQLDQLATATCVLSDANRVDEIQELFTAFGIAMLTDLRPEQYGAYAAALRQKGVTI